MTWTWLGITALAIIVLAGVAGYRRGFVREVVSTFFVILSFLMVWMINPYVNTFIREHTPVYGKIQESCREFVQDKIGERKSTGEEEQIDFIENLNLPALLKRNLEENNNVEVYRYLAVNTFTDYIADSVTLMVVNGLSFLISFLTATILIRAVTFALDILSKLPVINGANKMTGVLVGCLKCIIFIWIALLVVTLLCNTEFGRKGLELIQGDTFLRFLYDQNIFVKVFMSIFYGS